MPSFLLRSRLWYRQPIIFFTFVSNSIEVDNDDSSDAGTVTHLGLLSAQIALIRDSH